MIFYFFNALFLNFVYKVKSLTANTFGLESYMMRHFFTSLPFVVLSAVSMSVFSFDLYIPSLPNIAFWFETSEEYAKLTISAGIIGSSLFTLILGPLSDAIGRRTLLVSSQALFCLASFVAAFSPSIHFLILMRLIQGIGSSAAMVLSLAIITDVFPPRRAAIYFAYITTTITVTLVVAPMFGGIIASHFSWHYCFVLLGVLTALSTIHLYFFMPETLKERKPISMNSMTQGYLSLVKNPFFLVMSAMPSLMIGGFIAFISSLSFYFINDLGMNSFEFSLHQAGIMFFNACCSYLSGKSIYKWGSKYTAHLGMMLFMFGGCSLFMATYFNYNNPIMLCATFSFYGAGLGLVFSAVTSENMVLSPAAPGTTSAAMAFIRGCLISFTISFESALHSGELQSLGYFVLSMTFLCAVLFLVFRHKLRNAEPAEAVIH